MQLRSNKKLKNYYLGGLFLNSQNVRFSADEAYYYFSCQTFDVLYTVFLKVLSITYVKGGGAYDTTPPFVEFGGTLRSLTTEGLYKLQKRVEEV